MHKMYLGGQAGGAGGGAAAQHGKTHRSAKKFYTHWMQQRARAATLAHARHMLAEANALKARAVRLAATSAGRP